MTGVGALAQAAIVLHRKGGFKCRAIAAPTAGKPEIDVRLRGIISSQRAEMVVTVQRTWWKPVENVIAGRKIRLL